MAVVLNEMLIQPQSLGEVWTSARDVSGPASYTVGGVTLSPQLFALLSFKILLTDMTSQDGLYFTRFTAPSGTTFGTSAASAAKMKWYAIGATQGVASLAIATAGSGQTPGTYIVNATGGGGSGAQASITVAAGGTVTAVPIILNPGSGYTSAPTFTLAAGGTPATFTPTLGTFTGLEVPAGTNLSNSRIRVLAIGN